MPITAGRKQALPPLTGWPKLPLLARRQPTNKLVRPTEFRCAANAMRVQQLRAEPWLRSPKPSLTSRTEATLAVLVHGDSRRLCWLAENLSLRCLTFELSGRQRWDDRPASRRIAKPGSRAWQPAVGAPLERMVRPRPKWQRVTSGCESRNRHCEARSPIVAEQR